MHVVVTDKLDGADGNRALRMLPWFRPGFLITKELVAVAVALGAFVALGVLVEFCAISVDPEAGGSISANELVSPCTEA